MPTCDNCGKEFPSTKKIDGKKRYLHKRRYCLECSPFGENNRKRIHDRGSSERGENRKEAENSREDTRLCKECDEKFEYEGEGNDRLNVCKSCLYKKEAEEKLRKKRKLIKKLGGKCKICGYSKNIRALDFHHQEPENKEFTIGDNLYRDIETLINEVKKCIVLCANCHRIQHCKY